MSVIFKIFPKEKVFQNCKEKVQKKKKNSHMFTHPHAIQNLSRFLSPVE